MNPAGTCEECGQLVLRSHDRRPFCESCLADLGIGAQVARGVGLTGEAAKEPPSPAGDAMQAEREDVA